MRKLTDGMCLYHGSYCEVERPELSRGADHKDFGQGFYLTSSPKQAKDFIKASVKKAAFSGRIDKGQDFGFVSKFRFSANVELDVRYFQNADTEWLHCIVAHRMKNTFPKIVSEMKKHDVIVGKIANDNTNATIAAYMAFAYGDIGTKTADDMCIGLLLPERLQDQFCFRTETALECIAFMESEKVWL